jgi:hypothetical protein
MSGLARFGRWFWPIVAALYLGFIWLDGAGSSLPYRILPGTLSYFVGIAGLFPRAATNVTEYRVEGWVCQHRRWEELDYRAYFPLHADDKENRFHKIMFLYRKDRDTMEDLDDFFVDHHNAGTTDDGIPRGLRIGGVRLVSLRRPFPKPGEPLVRFAHKSLSDYPKSYRHTAYRTERADINERCGSADAPDTERIEPADKTSEY